MNNQDEGKNRVIQYRVCVLGMCNECNRHKRTHTRKAVMLQGSLFKKSHMVEGPIVNDVNASPPSLQRA